MESFGKFCAAVILFLAAVIFGGYVFMKMWEWLIVPVFNLQLLTLIQSIGVSLFVGFAFKGKPKADEDTSLAKTIENMVEIVIYCALILLVAYIIHVIQ